MSRACCLEYFLPLVAKDGLEARRRASKARVRSGLLSSYPLEVPKGMRVRACGDHWTIVSKKTSEEKTRCGVCNSSYILSGKNDLESFYPKLSKEWSEENVVSPSVIAPGSNLRFLWDCPKDHVYAMSAKDRVKGRGCTVCSTKVVIAGINDLATTEPEVAREWSEKNSFRPEEVSRGSAREAIFSMPCGHEWEVPISRRTSNRASCGVCVGKVVVVGENDLTTAWFFSDWDVAANEGLDPTAIHRGSTQRVGWTCEARHRWVASPASRARGRGCGVCSGASSKNEDRVEEEIKKIYDGTVLRGRRPLRGGSGNLLELDFWLPDLKLAFEVQDLATHSKTSDTEPMRYKSAVGFKKGPTYHEAKRRLAHGQLGVRVIELWEGEELKTDRLHEVLTREMTVAKMLENG